MRRRPRPTYFFRYLGRRFSILINRSRSALSRLSARRWRLANRTLPRRQGGWHQDGARERAIEWFAEHLLPLHSLHRRERCNSLPFSMLPFLFRTFWIVEEFFANER